MLWSVKKCFTHKEEVLSKFDVSLKKKKIQGRVLN